MTTAKSPLDLNLRELSGLLKSGEVAPLDLVEQSLARIERKNPALNAFALVLEEEARDAAKKAGEEIASGNWRGPLHGVPFAVKDLFDVAGLPTKGGSKVWADHVAESTAGVVAALLDAGAVLMGKLHMHELAFGITSRNPHYGQTNNPWNTERMCGGSSGGSGAAVASGMVPFALGSDTGGSIRIPSSLCGITGIKPTFGLAGRSGVLPLSWSMDHVGPMARSVDYLAAALVVMAGPDEQDPSSLGVGGEDYFNAISGPQSLEGLTVGKPVGFFFEDLAPDVAALVEDGIRQLADLGAKVVELDLDGILEADRAALCTLFSEAAACLEPHLREHPRDLGAEVRENLRLGMTIPATRYIQAQRIRGRLAAQMKRVFEQVDFLALPATPVAAPLMDATMVELEPGREVTIRVALTHNMRYFNLAGVPVMILPCGLTREGLPAAMQLVSGYLQEAKLFRAGSAFEAARPWPFPA